MRTPETHLSSEKKLLPRRELVELSNKKEIRVYGGKPLGLYSGSPNSPAKLYPNVYKHLTKQISLVAPATREPKRPSLQKANSIASPTLNNSRSTIEDSNQVSRKDRFNVRSQAILVGNLRVALTNYKKEFTNTDKGRLNKTCVHHVTKVTQFYVSCSRELRHDSPTNGGDQTVKNLVLKVGVCAACAVSLASQGLQPIEVSFDAKGASLDRPDALKNFLMDLTESKMVYAREKVHLEEKKLELYRQMEEDQGLIEGQISDAVRALEELRDMVSASVRSRKEQIKKEADTLAKFFEENVEGINFLYADIHINLPEIVAKIDEEIFQGIFQGLKEKHGEYRAFISDFNAHSRLSSCIKPELLSVNECKMTMLNSLGFIQKIFNKFAGSSCTIDDSSNNRLP